MKKVEEIVEGFLAYLVSTKQLEFLPQIIKELTTRLNMEEKTAYVTCAMTLTAQEETKIISFLKENFGRDFQIKVKIDPKIIAGFIIRIGDQVVDRSISNSLKTLVENLEG